MTNAVVLGGSQQPQPSVFPNPCSDQAQLLFPKAWAGRQVEVEILSSNGVPVHKQSATVGSGARIPTLQWSAGIYWVRCTEMETARLLGVVPLKVSR
jgi:hypothetical protein